MAAPPSAASKKMDRGWIRGVTKFSKPHVDGVREFMQFVSERFDGNEQILCPCCKCLNHIHRHQKVVEEHLYIHGMACTYEKCIYHGESLDAEINENVGHLDALSRSQASGSFYESGDAEDIEQDIVDKATTEAMMAEPAPEGQVPKSPTEASSSRSYRDKVGTLKKNVEDLKAATIKQSEELESLKKSIEKTRALLREFGQYLAGS